MRSSAENPRKALIRDVSNRLADVFVKKGFLQVPLPPEEANSELKTAFPLGRLKRKRDDGLDIVEIQFDKHGLPSFVINFGIVPGGGVILPWGHHLDQDAACVSALPVAYRLYSSRFRARWFELGFFSSGNKQELENLVNNAIILSDEINNWFEYKTLGKHMKPSGLPESRAQGT